MSEKRFEYCAAAYEREFDIKERLEQKAGLVFAFNGVVIGATFLNKDAVPQLAAAGALSKTLLVLLGGAVLASAVCAMIAVAVRHYQKEYPTNLYAFLFDPKSARVGDAFLDEMGGRFALATEHNAKVNAAKSRWLTAALFALLGSMVLVLLFTAASVTGASYVAS